MHNENISEKEEIKVLKKLLRSTDNKRMHVRYQVILLHLRDYTNAHIAKIMDLNAHTIGIYINSYNQNGVDGLNMGKSSGSPRFLSKDQEKKLYEIITTKTPDQVGFGNRRNWNANIARKWVSDNFHIEYSNRGMLQVLHRLNLSYTRPTYTLAKADEEKQEAFKQEFEGLKKPD
jgi:Transposase and inactivated derivatives